MELAGGCGRHDGPFGVSGSDHCSKRSDAPRPEASAFTRIAFPGTPACLSASATAWARDSPSARAADCVVGSLDGASPKPVTTTAPLPRLPAKAFTSSAAGVERLEEPSTNTMVAVWPEPDVGIGAGIAGGGGGGDPAAAGRAGGAAENAGCAASGGTAGGAVATAGGGEGAKAGAAAWDDAGAEAELAAAGAVGCAAAGGSRSALCTGRRGAGAGAGGAVTAGSDAFAVVGPGPGFAVAAVSCAIGAGPGGGAVPTPNRDGDALGDDGSANGVACAACCALVRSATNDAVSFFIASTSAGGGLGGTVDRFGYAASAPGGGGRCSAILPPCERCHQFTGFIEDVEEHPVSRQAATAMVSALEGDAGRENRRANAA